MKIRITNIKHLAVHDGDGIRTTVFLKGCSLKCKWCHNPEAIDFAKQLAFRNYKCIFCGKCAQLCDSGVHLLENGIHTINRTNCTFCGKCVTSCLQNALTIYGEDVEAIDLFDEIMEDYPFYQTSNGGVTFSGGEPLLQIKHLEPLLVALKNKNISINFDTCGAVPFECFECAFKYADTFLFDIKHFDANKHKNGTGFDNKLIIENLFRCDSLGYKTEIRIPLIPGFNDDVETIQNIGNLIKKLKNCVGFEILKYHNFAKSKYESLNLQFNEFSQKMKIDVDQATSIINEIIHS